MIPVTITLTAEAAALVERTLHEAADNLAGPANGPEAREFLILTDVCFALLRAAHEAGVEFPEY